MQLLALPLIVAALTQVAFGNFDIYRVNAVAPKRPTDYGYQIFANDPDCGEVKTTPWYGAKSDVGGKTLGITCDGDGCNNDNNPLDISWMEMHFTNGPIYHWVIEKDNDYSLNQLDGISAGKCIPYQGRSYTCDSGSGRTNYGYRKWRCITDVDAKQIHKGQ